MFIKTVTSFANGHISSPCGMNIAYFGYISPNYDTLRPQVSTWVFTHTDLRSSCKQIAKKHRLWTRYIETRDKDLLSQYKSIRNRARRETRKLHMLEQSAIASQYKKIQKIGST